VEKNYWRSEKMLMKPLKSEVLPKGENIIYELKYDGGSSRIKVKSGKVEIYHGDKNVLQNHKYPELLSELSKLKDGEYIAELCVINKEFPGGDFNKYLSRMCENFFKIRQRSKEYPATAVIHDIVNNDVLSERKSILKSIPSSEHVKIIEYYKTEDPILNLHKLFSVEGIVAKDLNSTYQFDKRSGWWKKRFNTEETVKCVSYEDWTKSDGTPGIVMTTDDGKRINLSGPRQQEAKEKIDAAGFAMVEIAYHKVSDKGFRFTTVKRIK
jgi:ATP-dependent DNA ligase